MPLPVWSPVPSREGGVWSQEGGGARLGMGCLVPGGVCKYSTPSPCEQTNMCKNITFPQLRLRTVKIPDKTPKASFTINYCKSTIANKRILWKSSVTNIHTDLQQDQRNVSLSQALSGNRVFVIVNACVVVCADTTLLYFL